MGVLYCTVRYIIVRYSTVQYSTALYSTLQYSTVYRPSTLLLITAVINVHYSIYLLLITAVINEYLYIPGRSSTNCALKDTRTESYNSRCILILIIISDLVRCTFTSVASVIVSFSHRFGQSSEDTLEQGKNIIIKINIHL